MAGLATEFDGLVGSVGEECADKYQRLADKYDRPLLTVDNEYIFVLKPNK